MSISSELLTLNNTKTAIRTAINNKGGSVGASDTFASYATAIDNLPSGGGDNSTLIDLIERDITSINIPSGTRTVGGFAFSYCSSLASVVIPNTVLSISQSVFEGCQNLTSITLPSSVTQIGANAFNYCTSLASINIPIGITNISGGMLRNCSSLTSITLPSSVTNIEMNAFNGCSGLTSFISLATMPPTVKNANAFNNTNNCPIYVPSASVAAYKAANNWSTYESRIYGIAQVATVDGNSVYNYDLGMTSSTTMITSTNMQKMPTGTSLELAEGIVDAGGSFGNYTSITLPSTFSSFDDQGMIGNTTTTLTCLATTPPTAERNDIGGANLTTIYVPYGTKSTYDAAAGWSSFSSIIQELPQPVTSITMTYNDGTSPGDWGDLEGCEETINVDSFEAASENSTFDSDIKAADLVAVEDNLGNDVTSQCTFTSSDYTKDDDGEGNYTWNLYTTVGDADEQVPHSATITATYGNLTGTFTIEWTTTSNCGGDEPEPDPEEEPEE